MEVFLPQPGSPVGPGLFIQWRTTGGIIPIPGSTWHLTFANDDTLVNWFRTVDIPVPGSNTTGTYWFNVTSGTSATVQPLVTPVTGQPVYVQVQLIEPQAGVVDSAQVTGTWDPTVGLGEQIKETVGQGGGGGGDFTAADRALLQQIDTTSSATRSAVTTTVQTSAGIVPVDLGAAFKWVSQDLWQRHPLTVGPTCEPIDLDVSLNALYGLELVITALPDGVQFRTPDQNWSFQDLAVLKFERNGVILERHGIHTLSHTVAPLPGSLWFGAFGVNAPIQPSGYHIFVDWLPGVCGEITGFLLPV